jgi:L-malate glycosyltransferase
MLKVLVLNYEFPPLGGGAGNACFYLLKEFKKYKNFQFDLITSSVNKYKHERFSKNINIYYLNIDKNNKNLHFQKQKDILLYSLKALSFGKKLKKEKKYDCVHAFFSIPSGLIALLLSKNYIVSLRGSDVPFYNSRFYWQDKLFFQYINKFIWQKATKVIANSNDLKNLALKTSPKQDIKIIKNGVDTKFFKPLKNLIKKNVILNVGRLIKRKNISLLLKGFSKINNKYKEKWQIWLVGEGPEKEALSILAQKLKIKKNVKFLGIKNKKELLKIYNQAKIFVISSKYEGMSNSLLEAIACGLPIITTNTGNANFLIKKNGIILNDNRPSVIKKALFKMIKYKKVRTKMAKQSRKIAKNLNWTKSAKKYLKIYQSYHD